MVLQLSFFRLLRILSGMIFLMTVQNLFQNHTLLLPIPKKADAQVFMIFDQSAFMHCIVQNHILSSWPISWNVSWLNVFKGINRPSLLDDKVVIMWFSVMSAWDMSFQGKNCRHERPLSLLYQRSMTVWNETFNEHRGLVWSGCLVWYLLRKSLDVYQVFVLLGIPLLFLIYFFTDDILIFCQTNLEEVENLIDVLQTFQAVCGQTISHLKSAATFLHDFNQS